MFIGTSSSWSARLTHRPRVRLTTAPRACLSASVQSTPTGTRAISAAPIRSFPGAANTIQSPAPTNGRAAFSPTYCLATADTLSSWKDHVPSVRSMLRLPEKNSTVAPTVLMPPSDNPKRTPSPRPVAYARVVPGTLRLAMRRTTKMMLFKATRDDSGRWYRR